MKILMMTNTFTPHVGGVARSVESFTREFRLLGHQVLIVAPEFPRTPRRERDVIRVPAIQKFNGSDFSVAWPFTTDFGTLIEQFQPDVVHTHHPFLLGSTAVRVSREFNIPLIFTHHTMYEQYTHYVPGDSSAMKQFAIHLAVGFCNLCDAVVAPSESVAEVLIERGVTTRIEPIPTGVEIERFSRGDGARVRAAKRIPPRALVVGHLGRLAPEKNLPFLAHAVAEFLQKEPRAWFLLVGRGPSLGEIKRIFRRAKVDQRVVHLPQVKGQALVDAYHAMDVFAFASQSETQGMVLTEAMAAGLPVVAVDASGAREVVRDGVNGRLLATEDHAQFVEALQWFAAQTGPERRRLRGAARKTAREFSMRRCARRMLDVYGSLLRARSGAARDATEAETGLWAQATRYFKAEWDLLMNVAGAATAAVAAAVELPTLAPADVQDREDKAGATRPLPANPDAHDGPDGPRASKRIPA